LGSQPPTTNHQPPEKEFDMANTLEVLRPEYEQLFGSMEIRSNRIAAADQIVDKIVRHSNVYQAIMDAVGMPWQIVGVIHSMESDLNFRTHLHNGDPLTARTVKVPAGRPRTGNPPFTFQESAIDALMQKKLNEITDWGVASTLFQLERYNGFGNRARGIHSPYLWSFCNHYTKGKFVQDGVFDPDAVSQQCGAVVLLRRMIDREIFAFTGLPHTIRVTLNGADKPVSAFVQKGNSWIAPRQLEPHIPETDVIAVRQNPFVITVQFKDKVRDFEGRMFQGRGHVDASDLVRDFYGFGLAFDPQQKALHITR
jgi:lysozyme family protein